MSKASGHVITFSHSNPRKWIPLQNVHRNTKRSDEVSSILEAQGPEKLSSFLTSVGVKPDIPTRDILAFNILESQLQTTQSLEPYYNLLEYPAWLDKLIPLKSATIDNIKASQGRSRIIKMPEITMANEHLDQVSLMSHIQKSKKPCRKPLTRGKSH